MTDQQTTTLHAAELVVRAMLGQDPAPAAIVRALADAGLLRTTPLTIYRAYFHGEGIGLYATRQAAAECCAILARADWPEAKLTWQPEELLADGVEWLELCADGAPTGYATCSVPVQLRAGEIG